MMNFLVFNTDAANLKTSIYGANGSDLLPVAVDANGRFLFSPDSEITVVADNLDIRDLSSATDSVTVVADNLDIRDLNGSQDSVSVYGSEFLQASVTVAVSSGNNYLLAQDIGPYRQNSFFLRNLGGSTVTIAAQIAPIDDSSYYMDTGSTVAVAGSGNGIVSVDTAIRYARLRVQAPSTLTVVVYYNARA
jgi:hypothetical protein